MYKVSPSTPSTHLMASQMEDLKVVLCRRLVIHSQYNLRTLVIVKYLIPTRQNLIMLLRTKTSCIIQTPLVIVRMSVDTKVMMSTVILTTFLKNLQEESCLNTRAGQMLSRWT